MQALRAVAVIAMGLVAIASLVSTSTAQVSDQDYVASQLRIKFRASAQAADQADVLSRIQATRLRVTNRRGWDLVQLDSLTVTQARSELQDDSAVEATAPNYYVYPLLTPNDSLRNSQWHLYNYGQFQGTAGADIKAFPAWDRISGAPDVRIAVLDTGIDTLHEDLVDNIWTNPNETWNGIDDDSNGYIDDVHGWDFVGNDPQPYDYTSGSAAGHGTGMSSIAAAKGNNTVGMAGAAWTAKIVPLKMIWSIDDAIEAIDYCVDNGIPISSNSWGIYYYDAELDEAVGSACDSGHLFIAAAGNWGWNNDSLDVLNPRRAAYPASFSHDCIISVTMTDNNDHLVGLDEHETCPAGGQSNYGPTTVDLAAPGKRMVRANVGGGYGLESCGTSASAPQVAAAAALLLAQDGTRTAAEIKEKILCTTDPKPTLTGRMVTGGRLNMERALDNVPPDAVDDLTVESVARWSAAVSWTAPGDDGDSATAKAFDLRYATFSISESNFAQATPVTTGDPGPPGTAYCIEIDGLTSCTTYYFAIKTEDDGCNVSALSNVPSGMTTCSGSTYVTCPSGFASADPEWESTEAAGMVRADRTPGRVAEPTYVFSLGPARPNPSGGSVTIGYTLAQDSPVSIRVYDVAGRLVKVLVNCTNDAGPHEVVWDGLGSDGRRVHAGVYFYLMTAGSWQSQRRAVFLNK